MRARTSWMTTASVSVTTATAMQLRDQPVVVLLVARGGAQVVVSMRRD